MKSLVVSILISTFMFSCSDPSAQLDTTKAPSVKVIDTDFSKGQLNKVQTLNLEDLVKLHGHLCDGLVVGYLGLNEAFKEVYPDGIVDRTNTRIVSKSSPCLADAALYLTGGRNQYGMFYVDNDFEGLYQIQRLDTKEAWSVHLKSGVKPKEIDRLGQLAVEQKLNAEELQHLKQLEDKFTKELLDMNPADAFDIKKLGSFQWQPKAKTDYLKTDIINKAVK